MVLCKELYLVVMYANGQQQGQHSPYSSPARELYKLTCSRIEVQTNTWMLTIYILYCYYTTIHGGLNGTRTHERI